MKHFLTTKHFLLAAAASFLWIVTGSSAAADTKDEKKPATTEKADAEKKGQKTVAKPADVAKKHMRHLMEQKHEGLKKSYADEVTLMPGHDLLKTDKIGAKNPSKESSTVKSDKVIGAIAELMEGRTIPAEKIEANLKKITIKALEINPVVKKTGDLVLTPPDPVDTPDGKLHFKLEKNDVMLKGVFEGKEDFVLFQMRKIDGAWRVVAELID